MKDTETAELVEIKDSACMFVFRAPFLTGDNEWRSTFDLRVSRRLPATLNGNPGFVIPNPTGLSGYRFVPATDEAARKAA